MNSDRNLLYGMLALQLDFVTRDQLIEAMQLWIVNKTRSVGEILVQQGHLEQGQQEVLDGLLELHLQKHHGDVHQSLASLRPAVPIHEELQRLDDQELSHSVSLLPDDAPPPARFETIAPTLSHTSHGTVRYEVLRPLSQGGLGKVSVARDLELHRDVAFKEILPAQADRFDRRTQFTLEAEVTGGLEHPGIVPVYGMGAGADGRPYYAMRLIHGDSMREVLLQFHQDEARRDRSALPLHKLLARFIDVCDAVHYAHSRGVLHRDLKPDNVMLGEFGETIVVDWGLAKIDRQAAVSLGGDMSRQCLSPPSASLAVPETPGAVVGTVDYMAPEQAVGDTERIGVRTDVYGLGAILFQILTGRPPAKAETLHEKLRIAERGEFPRPRALVPYLPKPLEAICLKALANRPADRYPTARALAEDVERWLADESVVAYREGVRERTARWMRRNWPRVQALIGSLFAIMLMFAIASWIIYGAKERETRAKLQEIQARRRADENKQIALANFRRARDAVDTWLSGPANDLQGYPGIDQFRLRLLQRAADDYATFAAETSEDPEIQLENGRTQLRLAQLLAELPGAEKSKEAETALNKARTILTSLRETSPTNLDFTRECANCFNELGKVALARGDLTDAEQRFQEAIRVVRQFAELPEVGVDETLGAGQQGSAGGPSNQPPPAAHRPAVQLTAALGTYLFNLGQATWRRGDQSSAEQTLRESLGELAQAAESEPEAYQAGYAAALQYLSGVLTRAGRLDEAETLIRQSATRFKEAALRHPGKPQLIVADAECQEYLAELLRNSGQYDETLRIYEELSSTYAELMATDLRQLRYQQSLGRVCLQTGLLQLRRGSDDDADRSLGRAAQLFRNLVEADPNSPKHTELLATTLDTQAQLWLDQDRTEKARAAAEESAGLLLQIINNLGTTRANRQRLAVCFSHLGQIAQRLNDTAAANAHFQNAIQYLSELLAQQDDPTVRNDLAFVWMHAAELAELTGGEAAMFKLLHEANKTWQALLAASPTPEYRQQWLRFATIYQTPERAGLIQPSVMVAEARQLTANSPANGDYQASLGAALYRNGQLAEAEKALSQAAALRGGGIVDPYRSMFEAMTWAALGNRDAARQSLASADQSQVKIAAGNLQLRRLAAEAARVVRGDAAEE